MSPLPLSRERPTVTDTFGRPLRSLRISVTDRCNLRCKYCMPEEEYTWLPRETILSFEEIAALADLFTELGVDKVRLTGGEPLLRKDLSVLMRMLRRNPRINDLALTTNGVLLAEQAQAFYDAGLHRVTVSLDTLKPERFKALTRRDCFRQVLEGIEAAARVGFKGLKFDTVAIRGYKVLSRAAILKMLSQHYGPIEQVLEESSAPAQRFALPDGTTFGIIASTTTPFCATCDRSRLTADGMWFLCLYATEGTDLGQLLRASASREQIKARILAGWQARRDRGAEQRKELERVGIRARLVEIERLRQDPRLEMHTRGG